jgi:hypothetical protein
MHHRWLIVALALLAAAGCGGSDGNDTETDTTQAVEEAEGTEPEPEPEPEPQAADAGESSDEDPSLHRPAEITLTITGRPEYAGTYRASGTSRTCGPQRSLMTGQPSDAFAVEFPYEGDFEIVDLSFRADTLPPGGTTNRYSLAVSLRTKQGGRPPGFHVNARDASGRESGSARLARDGGADRLTAQGKNAYGSIELTVLCNPKAK